MRRAGCGCVIGSVSVSQGGVSGGFIPRSRDTHEVGAQSRQLANPGNDRHLCHQLVPDRQGGDGGFHRGPRAHHQDRLVLPSRTGLGCDQLGPALARAAPLHKIAKTTPCKVECWSSRPDLIPSRLRARPASVTAPADADRRQQRPGRR
jgi:hypothetical protein